MFVAPMPADTSFVAPMLSLAIETSTRQASIALGIGAQVTHERMLPSPGRHRVELMPGIDDLMRSAGYLPRGLRRVYVSVGPGSFTGLRVAVATVKAMSLTMDISIVPVPTDEAIARQFADEPKLAVVLAMKQGRAHVCRYRRGEPEGEPMIADPLEVEREGYRLVDDEHARAGAVYAAGYASGRPVSAEALMPLYARRPEAEVLWERRQFGVGVAAVSP